MPIEELDLRQHREEFTIGGASIFVASLEQLLAIKVAAGRAKDLRHVAELEALISIRDHG